jgi:hypothetical protein
MEIQETTMQGTLMEIQETIILGTQAGTTINVMQVITEKMANAYLIK